MAEGTSNSSTNCRPKPTRRRSYHPIGVVDLVLHQAYEDSLHHSCLNVCESVPTLLQFRGLHRVRVYRDNSARRSRHFAMRRLGSHTITDFQRERRFVHQAVSRSIPRLFHGCGSTVTRPPRKVMEEYHCDTALRPTTNSFGQN